VLQLLEEHGGAIEADLLRSGLRMGMLFTGELTLRELIVLVNNPARDSAYARAALGAEEIAWTLEAHLLAVIGDRLAGGNWQRSGGKGPRPSPIRRPGVGGPRKLGNTKGQTPEQVRAKLEAMSGRTLAVPGT
jgi:hypothetical protein